MTRKHRWWPHALIALVCAKTFALAGDRSVTAAEANGTYRDGQSEIKILSTGRGKLKVEMNIVQPRDTGSASGEASIENDVAVFVPPETDGCTITMTFLPNGSLKVEQEGRPVDCGFGRMAPAEGTYKKGQQRQAEVRRGLSARSAAPGVGKKTPARMPDDSGRARRASGGIERCG